MEARRVVVAPVHADTVVSRAAARAPVPAQPLVLLPSQPESTVTHGGVEGNHCHIREGG